MVLITFEAIPLIKPPALRGVSDFTIGYAEYAILSTEIDYPPFLSFCYLPQSATTHFKNERIGFLLNKHETR